MKKLFLILVFPIIFIGCLEPSPEKLDSNWVKSVKGKTFVSTDGTDFIIFDDAANISMGNASESDISAGDVIVGLLASMMNLEFFRSPEKNKAVYKIELLFFSSYVGLSTDGKKLYMYEMTEIPDDINWDVPDEGVYSLYKGK